MQLAALRLHMQACALACALAFGIALACAPQPAFAYLNEVTSSYPASQDVELSGDVLTGADVPEGTYPVTVKSSSYMCKFTNATLTSSGGELWVTFTLSKAYNALYFGTAEDAAALSPEEQSTDYSPYITSTPLEGYVARQFTLSVPALNYAFELATFSGGNKGTDKGLWYTRLVAVSSEGAVDDAIAALSGDDTSNPGDDAGSDVIDEPGDTTSQDPTSPESGGDSDGDGDSDDGDSSDGDSDGDDSSQQESSKPSKAAQPAQSTPANNNASANQPAANEAGDDEVANSSSADSAGKSKSGGKRGKALSFVSIDEVLPAGEAAEFDVDERAQEQSNSRLAAAAGGVALVNVVLSGAFVVGVRRARPRILPPN